MDLRFWGTRGSRAVARPDVLKHGGNTTCIELRSNRGDMLVIDLGTGASELSAALGKDGVPAQHAVLLSHLHHDHVEGLPFARNVVSGATIYGPAQPGGAQYASTANGLAVAVQGRQNEPYFPVPLTVTAGDVAFVEVEPDRTFETGGFRVTPHAVKHDDLQTVLGFRIEEIDTGAVAVIATDNELGRYTAEERNALLTWAHGSDIAVLDAQYSPDELPRFARYGHSSDMQAATFASEAGVGTVVLTHHDPLHSDMFLRSRLSDVKRLMARARRDLTVDLAREGDVWTVGRGTVDSPHAGAMGL